MSSQFSATVMHRVLVAMDSPAAASLLPLAAELAAQCHAELMGLFVEDADLFRLAALPFAQEVCTSSATAQPLTHEAVERRLRVVADQLRQSLAETARRAEVRWSFTIARGAVSRLVEESARERDVLLLLPPRNLESGSSLRGSTTGWTNGMIAVVEDESSEAARALAIAGQVAQRQQRSLLVIPVASDTPPETQRAAACRGLPAHGVDIRFVRDRIATEQDLRRVLAQQRCSLLLLPAASRLIAGQRLGQFAAEISAVVALVR